AECCDLSRSHFRSALTTALYPLSLHDALPICSPPRPARTSSELRPPSSVTSFRRSHDRLNPGAAQTQRGTRAIRGRAAEQLAQRSEEHTSELQSLRQLVCRLLLEKKKSEINTT